MKYLQRLSTKDLTELMELLQVKRSDKNYTMEYYDMDSYIECEAKYLVGIHPGYYRLVLYDFYCYGKNANVDAMYNRQKLYYDYMCKKFGEEYKNDYKNFFMEKYSKNPVYEKLFGENLKSVVNDLKEEKNKEVRILVNNDDELSM